MKTTTFNPQLQAILEPIVQAALLTPTQQRTHAHIVRRHLKLLEELGEVAQAYLDVTGTGGKGKTEVDVLEEQVDTFIIATDTLIQASLLEHGSASVPPHIYELMLYHFANAYETYQYQKMTDSDFQAALFGVANHFSLTVPEHQVAAAIQLYCAAVKLLMRDIRNSIKPATSQTPSFERLRAIRDMVLTKVEKWNRVRELPIAA